MFKFLKSKKSKTDQVDQDADQPIDQPTDQQSESHSAKPAAKRVGWLSRLNQGLSKTRRAFTDQLSNLVLGKKQIDAALLEDLETLLLTADVGVDVCDQVIEQVKQRVARKELDDPERLVAVLRQYLLDRVAPFAKPMTLDAKPFVILMVGVNGAGKTTSIAKLAHYFKSQGKSVILAAGDTFRAAAVEQLQVWGERNDVRVVSQQSGADSASVIYDALQAALAKPYDVLIADTAGRLHTQDNLMQELVKIKRVMGKLDANAPHEVMLVIDAGMGQNALVQAEQFNQAVDLTSLCVTKLDGTAKGGIVFAITDKMKLPIRFIGVGEQLDDLKPFNADEFVSALFADNSAEQTMTTSSVADI